MTEDDVIVLARFVISRSERTAQLRMNAEDHEKFRGNEGTGKADGLFALFREIEFVTFGVSRDVHGFDLTAHRNESALGIRTREAHELIRLSKRKRTKKDAIDQRKD